tara:strand:- start:851 stop:1042 length:192 start_codon:yes stop_codon:yes gene_type:complete
MQTTTATYRINVTQECGNVLTYMRTMPTRPKTQKGIKAHNTKLENWAKSVCHDWKEIDVQLQD